MAGLPLPTESKLSSQPTHMVEVTCSRSAGTSGPERQSVPCCSMVWRGPTLSFSLLKKLLCTLHAYLARSTLLVK